MVRGEDEWSYHRHKLRHEKYIPKEKGTISLATEESSRHTAVKLRNNTILLKESVSI